MLTALISVKPSPVRIVIADDHPLFRDGLRNLLSTTATFDVVGEAANGSTTVTMVKSLKPDILLLDLAMPDRSGLDTLRLLADEPIPTRTIVLTAAIGRMETVQAVQLGAHGVVLKADASGLLLECIQAVANGRYWLGSEELPDHGQALRNALADRANVATHIDLSPREREIVAALAEGLTNREMAERFGVTVETIKHHLNSSFDKCGVSSRLELTLFALRHGLARL